MALEINPLLPASKIKDELDEKGVCAIDQFLTAESADLLYDFLHFRMPPEWWTASFLDHRKKMMSVPRHPDTREDVLNGMMTARQHLGKGGFSYFFDRTFDHVPTCRCLYCQYLSLMMSPHMIKFMGDIGLAHKGAGEFFASRFSPGHFLSTHTDKQKGDTSLVLGMTKDWRADWGGNLHILGDEHKVVVPGFNRLSVMKLGGEGKPHFVEQVANGAPRDRISITGWIK